MEANAVAVMRKSRLFGQLPAAELERLLSHHLIRNVAAGDTLFRSGDTPDYLFVVIAGEIETAPEPRFGPFLPLPHGEGDTVGEEAVLKGEAHRVTARALCPSTLVGIPVASFFKQMDESFDSTLTMMASLSSRLYQQVREITDLKMQSTAERLAGFLLSLAGQASGHAVVRLPFEKRQLADHLGMDPATLSRAFAKLRERGVTASRTDKVEIDDVARLRTYGDSTAIAR